MTQPLYDPEDFEAHCFSLAVALRKVAAAGDLPSDAVDDISQALVQLPCVANINRAARTLGFEPPIK